MTTSDNSKLAEELAKSLESATNLMQELLGDIKDNATSLALVKAKLESLSSSVEILSHIVRDGNGKGSMVTRLALVEKSVENIESNFDELKKVLQEAMGELKEALEEHEEEDAKIHEQITDYRREKSLAKLKVIAVVAPGAIALAIILIKMFMGELPIP